MSASRLAVFAAVTLSLAGCGILKKKQPDPAASVAVAPPVAPTPPPVAPTAEPAPSVAAVPTVDEASIPAPQDFEDEAFQKVTEANFKAELARLTKEITAKK
jgi:hypothetical protein